MNETTLINIGGRDFPLICLEQTDDLLCRFPTKNSSSVYLRLRSLCEIREVQPYSDEPSGENTCSILYGDLDEVFLDCSPDQFVSLLKVYQNVEDVRRRAVKAFA